MEQRRLAEIESKLRQLNRTQLFLVNAAITILLIRRFLIRTFTGKP